MKYKALLIIILIITGIQLKAQFNSVITDTETKEKMLIGYCDKTGLQKNTYGIYFESQYDLYKPSPSIIKSLKEKIKGFEFTVVLGTWCIDSQMQVPRFYKVIDEAGYNDKRVKVIAVDRNKQAIVVDIKDLNIEKIPTIIVYKNDVEIGRIVETPKKSIESDLWKIIKKK